MIQITIIRKCFVCGTYTFEETCPKCGRRTRDPHPPKFSPEDRYGRYRRMARKNFNNQDQI